MPPAPPVKLKEPEPKKPPPLPSPPKPKMPVRKAKKAKTEVIEIEEEVDSGVAGGVLGSVGLDMVTPIMVDVTMVDFNTEEYHRIYDNRFLKALDNPLSTFSIDVDTGSYSNVRRFLTANQLPPRDAVRIEEMINYFRYDYPEPGGKRPFSIITECCPCPWNTSHYFLHIGIQGKHMKSEKTPPSNLVFLIDVSGSMDCPNKLPLLKSSFRLLVEQLGKKDRVAIVVYAGAAGLVLPSTPGNQKEKILAAIDNLEAGGCTAGGAGIKLAYKVAEENFIKKRVAPATQDAPPSVLEVPPGKKACFLSKRLQGISKKGNNRIILATDGDFNIGVSSTSELIRMIEEKREKGVFLTTLGFGTGNYKDHRLEQLADKGNGSYHYIDNILEGKKVFVHDLRGTLFTIAKDVKIQVEFNPAKVESYRLIGYENRKLQKEDFDDDKKDAGELGSGHTVTALYEIVPVDPEKKATESSSLRFQESRIKADAFKTSEFALVKLRYKKPDGVKSDLITRAVEWKEGNGKGSVNSRFSAAVALFGMLLRKSEYAGKATYDDVTALAKGAVGNDQRGYRSEFLRLVAIAQALKN
jgi:Ca-activated chloride channel family protein